MDINRFCMYKQAEATSQLPEIASVFETTMNPAEHGVYNRTPEFLAGNKKGLLASLGKLMKAHPWKFGLGGGAALLGGSWLLSNMFRRRQ